MNPPRFLLFLVACMAAVGPVRAEPRNIILIRHGEKDEKQPDDNGLSLAGKARAMALVPYLTEKPEIKALGRPSFIFAQAAPKPAKNSLRPILTVQPYATSVGLPVLTPVERDDYRTLAKALLTHPEYEGKTVLICWEHHVLAEFAAALVEGRTVRGAPKAWKWPGGTVYGRTWVITYAGKQTASFADYAQGLMAGDAPEAAAAAGN